MILKKQCFTLAEVLIVIGVIGVVAAITIPILINTISEKAKNAQTEVIEDRLIQGLNQLNTMDNGLDAVQYANTEEFVKALSKHYKMTAICGAENMRSCFPYDTINYFDNNKEVQVDVAPLSTPEKFSLKSDEWLAPASFISAGGTPFVMLLKKDCVRDTGEAMQGIPTSCIQYMYDRNGSNIPNKFGTDIVHSDKIKFSLKAAPNGAFDIPIGKYTKYLILDENYPKGSNNVANAEKACSDAGYVLPSISQLTNLYCRATGATKATYYVGGTINCDTSVLDTNLAKSIADNSSLEGEFWATSTDTLAFNIGYIDSPEPDWNAGKVICLGK